MPLPIPTPWTTPAEVLDGLEGLEALFSAPQAIDRRGVFVTAYLAITREIVRRIDAGVFRDAEWMRRYLVAFAERYRAALHAFDASPQGNVPEPWAIAFAATSDAAVSELQDLLLGINAHIRYDLPRALNAPGVDLAPPGPERARQHQDHTDVNDALRTAVDAVQDRLADLYNPLLRVLDWAGLGFDEMVSGFAFEALREEAWQRAVDLRDGTITESMLAHGAAVEARRLLRLSVITADLGEWTVLFSKALRRFDGGEAATAEASLEAGPRWAATAAAAAPLQAILADLDRERSRAALLPAIYRELLEASAGPTAGRPYGDPAWVEEVVATASGQFVAAFRAFRAGDLGKVPGSWRVPLEAAAREDVTVPQLLALAANAIAHHDLAIALFRHGLRPETVEARRFDHGRLIKELDAAFARTLLVVAARYPGYVTAIDDFSAAVAEMIDRFSFSRTAEQGLELSLAIAAARHDKAARSAAFRRLDGETSKRALRIVATPLLEHRWLVDALRQRESSWTDPWSEWLLGVADPTPWRQLLGADFDLLPLPLRILLGEQATRRLSGDVHLTWGLPFVASQLGFPGSGARSSFWLEGTIDGDRERWLQSIGGRPVQTRHWAENGLLCVAFDAWRFRFRVNADAARVKLEQYDARFGYLPVLGILAPQVAVEIATAAGALHLSVTIDAPFLGHLVQLRARVLPE